MADRLYLVGARFHACHGALPHEATFPQPFSVDVELELDLSQALKTDRLEFTVDYRDVWETVQKVMEGPPRRLLETLAGDIADRLYRHPVTRVRVMVRKERPPLPGSVDCTAAEVSRG